MSHLSGLDDSFGSDVDRTGRCSACHLGYALYSANLGVLIKFEHES